jgi:hypothetical protein
MPMFRPMWSLNLTTAALACLALTACGGEKTDDTTGADTGSADSTSSPGETTGTPGETGMPTTGEPTTTTEDPSTTGTASVSTTSNESTGGEESTGPVGETAANGEPCLANGDCMSAACEKYRDLEMGVCVDGPGGGNTRMMGTTVDFATLMPVPNTEVRALPALTALMNPTMGEAQLTGTSDADGKLDVVSTMPIEAALGLVGIVQGGDYYPTATGLASPPYGPMTGNRDIWGVPSAKLTEWSGLLMDDPDFMEADPDKAVLPLGDAGGVVGFVRDTVSGMGVAGAVVVGEKGPTGATIRYLAEDGLSFTSDMTSPNGIFVLVRPGLAETFMVEGGSSIGTAGSAKGAVFVMILNVTP